MTFHIQGTAARRVALPARLRPALLGGVSLLALGMALLDAVVAQAAPVCRPSAQTIASSIAGPVSSNGGDIDILAAGMIGPENGVLVTNCGVGTLSNSGTIFSQNHGINLNGQNIDLLINNQNGLILGDRGLGILNNSGTINILSNAGTITGANSVAMVTSGQINLLTNTGSILGIYGVINVGSIATLNNSGIIRAYEFGYTAFENQGGTVGTLNNLAGGSIIGGLDGVLNSNFLGTLSNRGTIANISPAGYAGSGVHNLPGGQIVLLSNEAGGLITSADAGIANGYPPEIDFPGVAPTIGTLYNGGVVSGGSGIMNNGYIGTLTNTGTVQGSGVGVLNFQTISALINSGTIANTAAAGNGGSGIHNGENGHIGLLSNEAGGLITSADTAIANGGPPGLVNLGLTGNSPTIGTLHNGGMVSGGSGIMNNGYIGTLTNTGSVRGDVVGVLNFQAIATLSNLAGGGIRGGQTGIANAGTIGALSNSGTISGNLFAIRSSGPGATIGPILNSGVIQGNIEIHNQDVAITGSSIALYGALVGGNMAITEGNLALAGNLSLQQNITVRGGAGTVTNTGNLLLTAPQSITGNYAQGSAGALVIGANAAAAGRLNVSGTVSMLNATVNLVPLSGYKFRAGTSYVLVDAATSAGTSFAGTSATIAGFGATLETLVVGGDTELVLTLRSAQNYAQVGQASGARSGSMGRTLHVLANGTSPAATAFQDQVMAYIAALPAGSAQQNAVRETAPTQITPAGLSFQVTTSAVASVIEAHQLGAVAQGPGGPGLAAGSTPQGLGLWMQVMGGFGSRGSSASTDGYNLRQGGVMFGLDWQRNAETLLGVAFSAVTAHAAGNALSTGSSTNLANYQLTGFGTWRFLPQTFVYGQLGAGLSDYTQSRAIEFLGLHARASYGGQQLTTKAGLGHDIPLARGMTLTPLFGLGYARVTSASYTESGAGAANLTVKASDVGALTQDVGARLSASYATGWGTLRPELRLGWGHDYISAPIATTGTLAGAAFTTTTKRMATDGLRAGAAVTLAQSDRLSFRAEYAGDVRSNYASHAGLLRATMAW